MKEDAPGHAVNHEHLLAAAVLRRSPCKTELQPFQSNVVRCTIRQKTRLLLGSEAICAKKILYCGPVNFLHRQNPRKISLQLHLLWSIFVIPYT